LAANDLPKKCSRWSVEEFFGHFPVLEIDFTFYRPLLDQNGQPTQRYLALKSNSNHLKDRDRINLKVPQLITAQKFLRGDHQYIDNPAYINPRPHPVHPHACGEHPSSNPVKS
jgi:hypothetical protein